MSSCHQFLAWTLTVPLTYSIITYTFYNTYIFYNHMFLLFSHFTPLNNMAHQYSEHSFGVGLGYKVLNSSLMQDRPYQPSLLGIWTVSSFLFQRFCFSLQCCSGNSIQHNFELANTFVYRLHIQEQKDPIQQRSIWSLDTWCQQSSLELVQLTIWPDVNDTIMTSLDVLITLPSLPSPG